MLSTLLAGCYLWGIIVCFSNTSLELTDKGISTDVRFVPSIAVAMLWPLFVLISLSYVVFDLREPL